jgi:hypothetical protein
VNTVAALQTLKGTEPSKLGPAFREAHAIPSFNIVGFQPAHFFIRLPFIPFPDLPSSLQLAQIAKPFRISQRIQPKPFTQNFSLLPNLRKTLP